MKKVFAVRTPSIKSSILHGTLVGAGRGGEGRGGEGREQGASS